MGNVFSQVIVYQVKPEKVEEFEAMVTTLIPEHKAQPGCLSARYMKRFYTFDNVEPGNPPRELTKIVKCVKYFAYLEFDSAESCGAHKDWFFAVHLKPLSRLLIAPFDLHQGWAG